MVFIWGSVVNPSGLEAATAVCVWTGGLILVLDRPSHPPPSLIAATAGAAVVMVLMRGLSPLWLAVIAVSLAALAPRSLPVLIRQHNVRLAAGAVALAGVAAVAYIIGADALSVYPVGQAVPAGTSEWGVIRPCPRAYRLAAQRIDRSLWLGRDQPSLVGEGAVDRSSVSGRRARARGPRTASRPSRRPRIVASLAVAHGVDGFASPQ